MVGIGGDVDALWVLLGRLQSFIVIVRGMCCAVFGYVRGKKAGMME